MKAKIPPGMTAREAAQYLVDLRHHEQLARPHVRLTRARRRLAVVGLYTALIANLAWLAALTTNLVNGRKAIAVLYFLAAIMAIFFVVLMYAVGALNQNLGIDERERAQRDHATAFAYRILAVVLVGIALASMMANTAFGWVPALRADLSLALYTIPFIWLIVTLPFVVMAWTLPDPDPDPDPEPTVDGGNASL